MIVIRETAVFSDWLSSLKDKYASARVKARIQRLSMGNPGDVKPVGEGVSEMRIDYGPGYRVYFTKRGSELIILLVGGSKRTQVKDIKAAIDLMRTGGWT